MAEKNLIFISSGSPFLVNNVKGNLKKAGYELFCAEPTVKSLTEVRKKSKIILIYLGDYLEEAREAMIYLKDTCIEDEKDLIAIGSPEQINMLKQIVPDPVIKASLKRPLIMKDLLSSIEDASEKVSTKKTILVVDDDGAYLRSVKEWLSGHYQVVMVNSGMNAITYLASHKPDLVLLDYNMPVCDGPQTLEMIRSDDSLADTPVIFLTGKNDTESVKKALSIRPEGYLLKSMNPYQIVKSIGEFFEHQKIKS